MIRPSFSIYIPRIWIQLLLDRQSDIGEWWLMTEFELDIPSLTSEGIQLTYNAFGEVKELLCSSMIEWIANDWDADSLEYYITVNSNMTPSEHLLSLYPSSLWISETSQMNQISTSVESIVIQEGVGEEDEIFFTLSNLPSLKTLEMGCLSFYECHSIVFESMSDWVNDEWDLIQLQSIKLGSYAFEGDEDTVESNVLIMRSMNHNDWLMRSSFSYYIQRIWEQFLLYRQSDIGGYWLMTEFELDIPSLTQDGIQINGDDTFCEVKELLCSSMIDWLLMIEMLMLLNTTLPSIIVI